MQSSVDKETSKTKNKCDIQDTDLVKSSDRNKDDSETGGENKQVCTSVDDATDKTLMHCHPMYHLKADHHANSFTCLLTSQISPHSCSHTLVPHIWSRCVLLYGLLPFFGYFSWLVSFYLQYKIETCGEDERERGELMQKKVKCHSNTVQCAVALCFNLMLFLVISLHIFLFSCH